MRLSGTTKPMIFAFILTIGITLTLPYVAFAAGRTDGFTFYPLVVFIQQFQPAADAEPNEPAENRVYVQPRWVDGGHGVEVLKPGYWTEPKQAEKR